MAIENIPHIQPDEWLNGYIERLAILNGYKDAKDMFGKLGISIDRDKLDLIAKLLDITTETLVQEYTLIPAFRSIVSTGEYIPHGNFIQPNHKKKMGFQSYSEHVKFCSQCQQEDIGYIGYQYVRRSHQLFGALWCQKHNATLHEVSNDQIVDVIKSETQLSADQPNKPKHPIIERFIHISDALLSVKQPTQGDQVSWGLHKQAATIGVRFNIKGKGVPLSDYANEKIPHEWLHAFFPKLKDKIPGEFIPAIDGACVFRLQHHHPPTYVLAAALLFENADDALNCILTKQRIPPARKILRRNEQYWNSNDLYNTYVRHKGNCLAISKEIEGHYDTVRVNLIKYGLPPLTSLSMGTLKALKDFHNGAHLTDVLTRNDIQVNLFNHAIRHAGPRFFMAIEQLDATLVQQRKALKLRLTGKIKSASKASIFLKDLHNDQKLPSLI
ncbi:TniQ family protein [Methylophilus sp. 5]|uniref:TniQ family protein n=1 Tax=Methylophilus sp. 5 TaxID=1112274 RepID=UPI00048EBA07|nr:TniQ family protein [Methylophilus sp. 5]